MTESLIDSTFLQVSRTLLSILDDLNDAVVWMVSTRTLISKSSSPCTNQLVCVPIAASSNSITVTFMFHRFFSIPLQGPDTYISFRFLSILLGSQLSLLWEFFTSVLANGFSLEFEWQQVSSSVPGLFSVFWSFLRVFHIDFSYLLFSSLSFIVEVEVLVVFIKKWNLRFQMNTPSKY